MYTEFWELIQLEQHYTKFKTHLELTATTCRKEKSHAKPSLVFVVSWNFVADFRWF